MNDSEEVRKLKSQLAERDALLQRALPFLSNTPDLVQHGAEDLAQEIRSASAGKPCYGPNEWGTECGQCSKCESASAEPSAPVEIDERPEGCCCPPKGYNGLWAAGPCPVHQGLRKLEQARAALERQP